MNNSVSVKMANGDDDFLEVFSGDVLGKNFRVDDFVGENRRNEFYDDVKMRFAMDDLTKRLDVAMTALLENLDFATEKIKFLLSLDDFFWVALQGVLFAVAGVFGEVNSADVGLSEHFLDFVEFSRLLDLLFFRRRSST